MATKPIPILATLDGAIAHGGRFTTVLADYWALTKPEINFLIVITTATAFCLGAGTFSHFPWMLSFHALFGTGLVASAAATLNQLIEVRFDSQMRRTRRRPLALGRIEQAHAWWFGLSLSVAGVGYLAIRTNLLASAVAALTLVSYLFLYTPLKRKTPVCTLIGAVFGATPPLIGWAAARECLDREAWMLWAILFLWQFPHFMSIAWIHRDDYARAGYRVLPLGASKDRFVMWQTLAASLLLLPAGLIPWVVGVSGVVYAGGALVLGMIFLYFSVRFALCRSSTAAHRLMATSIIYLPAIFVLQVLDKK